MQPLDVVEALDVVVDRLLGVSGLVRPDGASVVACYRDLLLRLLDAVVLALVVCGCARRNEPVGATASTAGSADDASPAVPKSTTRQTRGHLIWLDARYRLIVKAAGSADGGVLDLYISENKVLVRQLQELVGREVIITGEIVRVPKGAEAIRSEADYTLGFTEFDIRPATPP